MQGWVGGGAPVATFEAYKKKFGADPYIYSFDLQGYGTGMFAKHKLCCMAGISDKVFDLMNIIEKDKDALVHVIESIPFDGSVTKFVNGVLAPNVQKSSEEEVED
jgi:hypothetical protein